METLAKPDNVSNIRPGQGRRKGLQRLRPKSLASIRQEIDKNTPGIYQPVTRRE